MTTFTADIVRLAAVEAEIADNYVPAIQRTADTDCWLLNADATQILRCPRLPTPTGYEFECPEDITTASVVVKHDGFPIFDEPFAHTLKKGQTFTLSPQYPVPATWLWWKG